MLTIKISDYKDLKFEDFTSIRTGKKNANASSVNGKFPFFTCAKENLYTDTYEFDEEAILISGNGDINVKYYKGKFDAYQRTYVITANQYFFYLYCISKNNITELINSSQGSVIKFITLKMLKNINVKIGNQELHAHFEYDISLLMNEITDISNKIDSLTHLKIHMLDKYFS